MASVSGGERSAARMSEISASLEKAHEALVGFFENARYPDGTPVAAVAALNNYGAPAAGIPARPFFTDMIRDKSPGWAGKFAAVLKAVDFDAAKALDLMGEGIAGQLREAIVTGAGPANSPVTDLLKQRFPMREGMTFGDVLQARRDVNAGEHAPAGKPLVWTGHLLGSVGSEVR